MFLSISDEAGLVKSSQERHGCNLHIPIKTCENGWSDISENENSAIKIARVSLILISKSINLLYFCTVLGSVVIEGDFPCIVHL